MRNGVFAQPIDEISETRKDILGEEREEGGNIYVYSKNSADVALRIGESLKMVDPNGATHYSFDDVATNTAAVGQYAISQIITATAGDTIVAGEFAGMLLYVNDGTGEAQLERIKTNTGAASAATFTITLEAALTVALTAAGHSDITIIPQNVVTETAVDVLTQRVVGVVSEIAVTASYYFWRLKEGIAGIFVGAAGAAAGESLSPGGATTPGQALELANDETADDVFIFASVLVPPSADDTDAMSVCYVQC